MPREQPGASPEEARFEIVDPRQMIEWDNRISQLSGGSIFHSSGWCNVLCGSYRYTPEYIVALEGERLVGILPLIEVNSWITGRRGICLPFTDECGPVGDRSEMRAILEEQAKALGKTRSWKYLQVRANPADESEASVSFYSHSLRIASSDKELLATFAPAIRRGIRKAESAGVTVSFSSEIDAMREYHRLHCLTRKRHGLPPQPFQFFRAIHQEILAQGHGFVALASAASRVVAGAVFFTFASRAHYKFGGSDLAAQELRPNNILMWTAIRELRGLGCRSLDFGRTSLFNEGLRRFKLGWGAAESALRYRKWDFDRGRFTQESDRSSGWQNFLFHRSPILLSRAVGRLLYRHAA